MISEDLPPRPCPEPTQQNIVAACQTVTPSPSHSSRSTSPAPPENFEEGIVSTQKKKKKKKPKKSAKSKDHTGQSKPDTSNEQNSGPVLCISRNKHWRYISSYHGPWLQLPLELLESLLLLNLDPATFASTDANSTPPSPSQSLPNISSNSKKLRDNNFPGLHDYSPPDSPQLALDTYSNPPPFLISQAGKATPPPIDPGVFRSVTTIRKLIDEAAELSVRASSGLSAAALGAMRGGGGSAWAAVQSLGINVLGGDGGGGGGGRNAAMSAMRIHRLRAMAVQKLAAAYKTDEIASSVMIMQGGSVFDDIAERVLKVDPNDVDARYVHFFHEKIPSRQLAESTTTQVLDELIAAQPQRLEFYRTRGIVRCFRDEYALATKDFTHALKEARAVRRAKMFHHSSSGNGGSDRREAFHSKGNKKKGGGGASKISGQASPHGTTTPAVVEGPDGEPLLIHPSVLPDAPDPIEPQLLFLRGAAYLQHAAYLVEDAILTLEGIKKVPLPDGAELRLCYIENGKYGGVEIGNPDGPLGSLHGRKLRAYRDLLGVGTFREQVSSHLKKSIRDHQKFLAHFDTLEGPPGSDDADDLIQRIEHAFLLSDALRTGDHTALPDLPLPTTFTTYHPLLVESHFSVLICMLMLGDFATLLPTFSRTAALVDGLEGYPVFLPPRSMAQAEFLEVLERLAGGWKTGILSHSWSKFPAIEAPPTPVSPTSPLPNAGGLSLPTSLWSQSRSSTMQSNGEGSSFSGRNTPCNNTDKTSSDRVGLVESLESIRILLAPVAARQRARTKKAAVQKMSAGEKKKPLINIPLHGPRVEVILAWLAATHLTDLEAVL